MKKYRILEVEYENGANRYIIQKRIFMFFWVNETTYPNIYEARFMLSTIEGQRIKYKKIVE